MSSPNRNPASAVISSDSPRHRQIGIGNSARPKYGHPLASSSYARPPSSAFGSVPSSGSSSLSKFNYGSSDNVSSRKSSNGAGSEFGVAELAEALRRLSRDARFRSIRPLWQDPNSRRLPSDEAASVEAMLQEYNQLLNAASGANASPPNPRVVVRRPYHTTLNRWRQQERIQIENFVCFLHFTIYLILILKRHK